MERFGPGRDQSEVLLYTVAEMGHAWPGGMPVLSERIAGPSSNALNATDEMWRFFERHALNAVSEPGCPQPGPA